MQSPRSEAVLVPAVRAGGVVLLAFLLTSSTSSAQPARPIIPTTWDDAAIAKVEVPLANPGASPRHVTAEYYYKQPVLPIYKSYPIYAPGREPAGYWDWLQNQEPEIIFSAERLRTEQDWARAGELVFDAPIRFVSPEDVHNADWYEKTGVSVLPDGTMP